MPALAAGPEIVNPPQSRSVVAGDRAVFTVVASSDDSLTYQWQKAGVPIGGATGPGHVILNVQAANAGTYSVAVTADGETVVSDGAELTVNSPVGGDVDFSFDPGSSVSGDVLAMAVQSDGKVLIGGNFTTVNGAPRNRIARLNPDGSTGLTFGHGMAGANSIVRAIAIQSDGKVLIGGNFWSVNGVARTYLARLNSDGSLDADFQNVPITATGIHPALIAVNAVEVQGDGKVLVGGAFTSVHGVTRNYIARLNGDGSLDTGFQNGLTGANNAVTTIAIQGDDKMIIGGQLTIVNGVTRNRIARLNSDGSLDTGFQNGLTGASDTVENVAIQSDGKVVIGGHFTSVNGVLSRNRIARLNSDGSLDTAFQKGLGGANNIVNSVELQGDGKILIGGFFGTVNGVTRNRIARLNNDGSLDADFQSGLTGANLPVRAIQVRSDGKMVIAGIFTSVNGASRNRIARLNSDGSLDADFENGPAGADTNVLAIEEQSDGKVLIGGSFSGVHGVSRNRIARLNGDGSLDTDFLNGLAGVDGGVVYTVKTQSDGKVLIAGTFSSVNGGSRNRIARLNDDGSLDPEFPWEAGATGTVRDIEIQSDGKAVIGGDFSHVRGMPRSRIARLNSNGSLDTDFLNGLAGADNHIYAVEVQSDGKVLIGGLFTSVNGVSRSHIARLNDDGSLDTSFLNGLTAANAIVVAIEEQSDGKILIGGDFTSINGASRNYIARLNSDGSLDATFQDGMAGANNPVHLLKEQSDGKVVIAGFFSSVNEVSRNRIARLNSDGSLDTNFQNGLAGAINIHTLDVQSDGKVLIGGGFTSVNGVARERLARLHSESIAELTVSGVTAADKVYDGGTTATVDFSNASLVGVVGGDDVTLVTAEGSGSFENSEVGENKAVLIAGLTLSGADAGKYTLTQPTATASITAAVAELVIINQPQPVAVPVTHRAVFSVLATGEGPLTYQWFKGETPIPGEMEAALVISNVQLSNIGLYSVEVTDDNGTTNSEEAGLAVNELQPGDLDLSFDVGSSINGIINALAVQPDGKVIIGGNFTMIHGAARGYVARLNPDGSTDHSFGHGQDGANSTVVSVAVAPDGKILIGGGFTAVNGTTRNRIARLNHDGSVDSTFLAGLDGANGSVQSVAMTLNGTVLIGGLFTEVNGVARNRIARLHHDGSLDTGFLDGLDGANNSVFSVSIDSDGKILIGGSFTEVNGVTRNRIARLNGDGTLDTNFQNGLTGANNNVFAVTVQSDGKVLIGGAFLTVNGVSRGRIARLNDDGSLDTDFQNGMDGADNWVYAIEVQSDGKVLIGGNFWSVNGETRNKIARLNSDGSMDSGFLDDVAGANHHLRSVAVAPDGGILIAGWFTEVNGVTRNRIAALHSGGSLNNGFDNGPTGANEKIFSIAVAPDERILIGGIFTEISRVARNRIARLNSDGSLDAGFQDALAGANDTVWSVAVDSNGKILIGGSFTEVNGVTRNRIARLNSDGSLDTTFQDGLAGADHIVLAVEAQSDGKVLIGGLFAEINGIERNRIARLNSDGSLDTTFLNGLLGATGQIDSVAVNPDGKILIGGTFTNVNGISRNRIARLNSDGSLDTGFLNGLGGANGKVNSVGEAPHGKVLIGGEFTSVNGVPRNRIARLNNDGSLDTTFLDGLAGANGTVDSLALTPDGKILTGGSFTEVNGVMRNRIARLHSDGSPDTEFLDNLSGANARVWSITMATDGKIFIGGEFTEVNGEPAERIAALSAGVEPITLTVTGVTASDKVYDGETTATVDFSNASLIGVADGDDVTLVTTEGAGLFENSEIGDNKTVLISGLTLNGVDAGSYTLTQPMAIASIIAPVDEPAGVLVSFGGNDAGANWNSVTAAALNTGNPIALDDNSANPSGVSLRGFAPLDPSLTAYDPAIASAENTGIWNGGAAKEWVTPDAAQDYILFEAGGTTEFFIALTGLDPAKQYRVELLAATEHINLDQANVIVRSFGVGTSDDPDQDFNGSQNLGGQGELNTQTEGWQAQNWLIWDSAAPGVTDPGVLGLPGDGSDTLVFASSAGSAAVFSALRIAEVSGFSFWADANGVVGGAGGDDDGDGVSNLLEYALGLDPQQSSPLTNPLTNGVVSYAKGTLAVANSDVSYLIETSPDLQTWTGVVPDTNTSTGISYTLPSDATLLFARLRVALK